MTFVGVREFWDQRHHIGCATATPDSTLAAWPYLQGGKAIGHAHAHAHTLMPDGDDCILLVFSFFFSLNNGYVEGSFIRFLELVRALPDPKSVVRLVAPRSH